MAAFVDETTIQTWQCEEHTYEFDPYEVPRLPHAWERAPIPAVAPQHKGRKVWKRYEFKHPDPAVAQIDVTTKESAEDVNNGLRPVKKQCQGEQKFKDMAARFIVTQREMAPGTPRRKVARRRSSRNKKVEEQSSESETAQLKALSIPIDSSKGRKAAKRRSSKVQKMGHHSPQPVEVEETQPIIPVEVEEIEAVIADNTTLFQTNSLIIVGAPPLQTDLGPASTSTSPISDTENSADVGNNDGEGEDDDSAQSVIVTAGGGNIGSKIVDVYVLMVETTAMNVVSEPLSPISQREETDEQRYCKIDPAQSDTLDSTLPVSFGNDLAQEISNFAVISPQKVDGLGDSEMFTGDASQEEEMQNDPNKARDVVLEQQLSKAVIACSIAEEVSSSATSSDAEEVYKGLQVNLDESISKNPGSSMRLEPSETQNGEVKADHLMDETEIVPSDTSTKVKGILNSEVPSEEQSMPYQKRTRSGARFSDDTDMLKDFLNRAQARKAKTSALASEVPHEVKLPEPPQPPPRQSPRKALAQLDNNSPTTLKLQDPAIWPGTPPSKQELNDEDPEDCNELDAESLPRRRSARKRLPLPAKLALGAPSFIPLRRADGADPIVLQKSVAQELAILTRTNTRRNKGQAKPAKSVLQALSRQALQDADVTRHKGGCTKAVSWDDRLVYFQDTVDSPPVDKDEESTDRSHHREIRIPNASGKVLKEKKERKEGRESKEPRKVRDTNGTPAPKRMMATDVAAGATPNKRPGKSRG